MSDWVKSTIEKVTKYQKAGGTPVATNSIYYGGDIPFVVIEDITKSSRFLETTEKTINSKGLANSAAWLIQEPHILYSMYATVGKPIINKISCTTNQAIIALKENEIIDQEFLYYQLLFIRPSVYKFTAQTTQSNLNAGVVKRLPIFYPKDKATQKKISLVLSTIDRTIAKTEALIEKYQQIKAGLMHDLFTRGIGADGKLRSPREEAPELYQETAIGWIPKEWELEFLDRLTQRGSGHTPNKSIDSYWSGGLKWVSLADSRKLDNLYISDTDLEISELGIQNSSAVIHPIGTVIMTRDAGVGKSAIISEPMAVSQHFMAWRCGDKMNSYFLYYWLQYKKRMFENVAMGSTIVTIGLPYFKKLRIAAPSKVEQERIGERLRSTDTSIFSLKSELEKFKYKKSGLMHDLLTGKVTVNVDPALYMP